MTKVVNMIIRFVLTNRNYTTHDELSLSAEHAEKPNDSAYPEQYKETYNDT